EAAEVTGKVLDTCTHGDEVIIWTQVLHLPFNEAFLQSHVHIHAIGSALWIDVYDSTLLGGEVVDIEGGREDDAPIFRAEAGVSLKEFRGKAKELRHEELAGAAEEFLAAGAARGDQARRGELAAVDSCDRLGGEVEEVAIAEYGIVAFELVAVEGI